MSVSVFGLLVAVICGYLLVSKSPLTLLLSVLLFSLMGGSAAIILTSLGGSSVRPELLALVFLAAGIIMPGRYRADLLPQAVVTNFPIVLYCLYSFVAAILLPRIFVGDFNVVPMNPRGLVHAFDTTALTFTNQNITTSVYMLGTMMAAIASTIAVQHRDAAQKLIAVAAIVTIVHCSLGIMDVFLRATPLNAFFEFFRNAGYAQLNQSIGGFVRMNGIFPEPSAYANFLAPAFVLCTELWLRQCKKQITGPAALLGLLTLAMTTSSSAILSLAAYFVILGVRVVIFPKAFPRYFYSVCSLFLLGAVVLTILALVFAPDFTANIAETFDRITVEKSESSSGQQRLFWAMQGIELFQSTYGIGIGPGSFRSSSVITAVLGSTGLLGMLTFVWFLLLVLNLFSKATYTRVDDDRLNVSAAFGWAMLVILVPASVASPSPDPGILYGVYGGIALGLRLKILKL